ncbi:4-hydroxy-tetrahydrodipicolinate synthase [Rothia aeria]|uniref:4-hydroxy-tetrahydrodipicolinate synthase n=1 Tax=Rothia aeria TaxID=172042 RepID=UPI002889BF97|nr:4-hydroxy-tetrahydrodipicolinate synthase [Rothia aeria]
MSDSAVNTETSNRPVNSVGGLKTPHNQGTFATPIFGRLLTAMVTPFAADGSVDEAQTVKLAEYLVDNGHDGLVVCGTTGEYSTMTDDENERVFQIVKDAVGHRAKIVAGVGSNDTAHTIELARRADKVGVDGLLVVTPYYNKPTQAGVFAHYQAVAKTSDTPIMVYDIPGRSAIPIEPDTYRRMAEIDSIVAVKDAKADFGAASEVMATTDLQYYSGDDGLTLPWMSVGAVGLVSVTAHVAPQLFRELIDAVVAQDLVTAQRVHLLLTPIVRATMSRAPGCVSAKQILSWQGVLGTPVVRLPHVLSEPAVVEAMRSDLRDSVIAHSIQNS